MKFIKNTNALKSIFNILKGESFTGVLLLMCAVIALIIANSNLASFYNEMLHANISIGYKQLSLSMPTSHWINDGLMVIFFFVVGMEIKKELLIGELKALKTTILPIAAAIGGMLVPATIYSICNFNDPTINGFGIPMATDIAFALGVLSIVGKKAPKGIVVFLTALAVVDDLGAIIVIAIFYTNQISWIYFIASLIILMSLILANRLKVTYPAFFIILGVMLWFTILKSGIHATFAGVLLGLTIPGTRDSKTYHNSMLHRLEYRISPWSSYLIMPIFALANAGVVINRESFSTIMTTPVSIGIILGLFLGKQIGIFLVSYLLVKFKIASLPYGVNKKHLYGASILGGIGFTMSIFVSTLSFSEEAVLSTAKLSIILVSLLSAIYGSIFFKIIEPEYENDDGNNVEIDTISDAI